ncbi:MAG: zinc ABC transporter substrate-binding protein [Alphaproteobacteria bacterium]
MITAHDAFGYFGDTYGLEVIGVQGLSTESEAGLQRIEVLTDRLATEKIPAVFAGKLLKRP